MSCEPILVVMAAGMGSRYGGLKQIDPVGRCGEAILDYSLFDARAAGFKTVVFIIKHEIEADFKASVGKRAESSGMEIRYAFQQLDKLPAGFSVPEGRVKPWGTAHAVLCAKDCIDGPFAVINADDYYGPQCFKEIYTYLSNGGDTQVYDYAMVGFLLKNTVSENGHVSRGVCTADENGFLSDIVERTHIETCAEGIRFTTDEGTTWQSIADDTVVSMNLWGFTQSFLTETEQRFSTFLTEALQKNPMKGEYFLPSVVSQLIEEGRAQVKVLRSSDKWYGVTYQEDKPQVVAAIGAKIDAGQYPSPLWGAAAAE